MMLVLLTVALVFAGCSLAHARAADSATCGDAGLHQFGFWLGDWKVYDFTSGNRELGAEHVTMEKGGCVLHERWNARDGRGGSGVARYDRNLHVWHESWKADSAAPLLLEGRFRSPSLIVRSETRLATGGFSYDRMIWTRLPNGSVRKLWERSLDRKKWNTVFDGLCVKNSQVRQ